MLFKGEASLFCTFNSFSTLMFKTTCCKFNIVTHIDITTSAYYCPHEHIKERRSNVYPPPFSSIEILNQFWYHSPI